MGTFFNQVLALLRANFTSANTNVSTLISLFASLMAKVKAQITAIDTKVTQEVTDRQAAITQEIQDRNSAISSSETSVLGQVDFKINPLKADIDLLKSGAAKIIKYLLDPSLPTMSISSLLTSSLANLGESVLANRTYLVEFVGNATGEMSIDNNGTVEAMSSGEKYLIHTDSTGAIATAEKFQNSAEEIAKEAVAGFTALRSGLEDINAENQAVLALQAAAIAQLQADIAAF